MQGTVYKIHSDFYYVKPKSTYSGLLECKLREILKKQKIKIKVGDFVEIDDAGAICSLLKRKNTLNRPCVSNLDLIAVISSLSHPDMDFNQIDRYLTFLKYYQIPALLCFNKDDLVQKEELADIKSKICSIYEPLGYKIVFTSALYKNGIDEFKRCINDKTIALCGVSGVGKSSVLKALSSKQIKTGSISLKSKRGCHTTRHCEIIEFENAKIIDTPGFSKLTFDFILPDELIFAFDEIKSFANNCRFSNCLHTKNDKNCNVIKNLNKIPKTRYQSYLAFLNEALEFKQKSAVKGKKQETASKLTQNRIIAKISEKKRSLSRKKLKQNLGDVTDD